jgi:ABC-2 type transport system permease protein
MTFAVQTALFFRRKLLETLRQPVWIITGLTTPVLYLALFEPLLRSLAGGPAFPPGHVLDVFVPGIMVLIAFGAGMGAGWPVIWELDSGVIERFRVTPAGRLALLLGTVLRDIVMFAVPGVVVIVIASVLGFDDHWAGLVLLLVLLALLTAACSATSSALGLILKQIGSLAAVVTGVQLPLTTAGGHSAAPVARTHVAASARSLQPDVLRGPGGPVASGRVHNHRHGRHRIPGHRGARGTGAVVGD